MRDLQMAFLSQVDRLLLALTVVSTVTYAPHADGQDFRHPPLPSFYAGNPDGMPRGERETPPKPSTSLAQMPDLEGSRTTAHDSPAADGRAGQAPVSTWVYDGLPVDGPQAYRPSGPPPPHYFPGQSETPSPRAPHAANHSAYSALEGMPHAALLQNYLELIKENCELKAQLKIQQVEFEAKQRVAMAEHEARLQRHEAERRIAELEKVNADLQSQQKAEEHPVKQTREMFGDSQELRRQRVERNDEMERDRQSKSELEHRGRAFEARLKQMKAHALLKMKAHQDALLKAAQQAAEKQIEKREIERAQKREKRPDNGRDKEHGDGQGNEINAEQDEQERGKDHEDQRGEQDREQRGEGEHE